MKTVTHTSPLDSLPEETVVVVNLPTTDVFQDDWLEWLSSEELERSSRFHFAKDRHEFLTTRLALRCLLASFLKTSPQTIQFQYSRFGKPELADQQLSVHFNISHCDRLSALAFSTRHVLGIDVECHLGSFDILELATSSLSETEAAHLAKFHNQPQLVPEFFSLWTRKEAVIKALGLGLQLDLKSFQVPTQPSLLIADRIIQLHSLEMEPGFSQAVAALTTTEDLPFYLHKTTLERLAEPFST